jgi:hypothetical protein
MASPFHSAVATALLLWHSVLSLGGYGLHDVLGWCHAPGHPACRMAQLGSARHPGASSDLPEPAFGPSRGSLGSNCHSCCHAGPRPLASTPPETRRAGRSPAPAYPEGFVSASDEAAIGWPIPESPWGMCPLCQWLGQPTVAAGTQAELEVSARPTELVVRFAAPRYPSPPRPFSPRGPPA